MALSVTNDRYKLIMTRLALLSLYISPIFMALSVKNDKYKLIMTRLALLSHVEQSTSHLPWGKNTDWGCLRMGRWKKYLKLSGSKGRFETITHHGASYVSLAVLSASLCRMTHSFWCFQVRCCLFFRVNKFDFGGRMAIHMKKMITIMLA